MKYFICALEKTNIGIPAFGAEKIIPVSRVQDTVYGTGDGMVYISLPVLFLQKDYTAPHGLVLKPAANAALQTVLLTPRIENEMEIPEKEIRSMPGVLTALNGRGRMLGFFCGVHFTGGDIIFILDLNKLLECKQ